MTKILEFRAILRVYYQKFQAIIDPVVKFIVAFIVFHMVNQALGYDERLTKIPVEVLLSLFCAFTPSSVLVFLAMLVSLLHVYSVSVVLVLMAVIIFLILYCFFFRFAPKYGYAVVAVPLLFPLNLSYSVPLFLGLTANPITILPTSCGIVVYHLLRIINTEATAEVTNLDDILELYIRVLDSLVSNKQMILEIIVFALVITAVYLVRLLKIEYAFEISIAVGAAVCILGFLIGSLKFDTTGKTGSIIVGTLLSAAIVLVLQFFKRVLDYTAVENVQFEDDDYYYYVKAVPKIDIAVPHLRIKRINDRQQEEEPEEKTEELEKEPEMERRIRLRRETKRGQEPAEEKEAFQEQGNSED